MVEPRWKDWKETWFADTDVELDEENSIFYHRVWRLDDDSLVRFSIEQQVYKPGEKQPYPVYRVEFDGGKMTMEKFGNQTRKPLSSEVVEAETNNAAIAFLEANADIYNHREDRKSEWEQ